MTCEIAGKRLFLCDCSKSMRLDKEKLGKMLHVTEDFNIYQFKNELPNQLSSFWLLCYTPRVDFNCNISSTKSWKLTETKKKFLIEAKLFIKN